MNRTILFYLLGTALILSTMTTACKKSEQEIETESLTKAVDQAKVDSDFKWVVVLPGLGCHGCIQEAEAFMRDHINQPDILFVLTKISSLKILQQKTGVKIEEHPNVFIDKEDVFYIPTDNSIYPCIIRLEKGKIVNHEFQSPKNGEAFLKLKKLLLAQ